MPKARKQSLGVVKAQNIMCFYICTEVFLRILGSMAGVGELVQYDKKKDGGKKEREKDCQYEKK